MPSTICLPRIACPSLTMIVCYDTLFVRSYFRSLPYDEAPTKNHSKKPEADCSGPCCEYMVRGGIGNVLLSHRAAPAVSLGPEGLTTVFGMGTGVPPPL